MIAQFVAQKKQLFETSNLIRSCDITMYNLVFSSMAIVENQSYFVAFVQIATLSI